MNLKKHTMNYMLIGLSTLAITACGGGSSGGSSSSCLSPVTDSDGDGFHDGIDIAPNNASIPGDFSTPEKILANPAIKKVLKRAKEEGINFQGSLENSPPNLTGYYRIEFGSRNGSISSEGRNDGSNHVGDEEKVCTVGKHYDGTDSLFTLTKYAGVFIRKNSMLRGDKNTYTIYTPLKARTCGNLKTHRIMIRTGKLNSNGDRVDEKVVIAVVYPSAETLTPACDKWVAGHSVDIDKINSLDELEHMCVDDNKAYAPSETWINKDKESCKCTTEYEIECK